MDKSTPSKYTLTLRVVSIDFSVHTFHTNCGLEWLSGDMNSEILWDSVKSNSLIYHYASRKSPSMDEISDMAEDSTLYYAYPNVCTFHPPIGPVSEHSIGPKCDLSHRRRQSGSVGKGQKVRQHRVQEVQTNTTVRILHLSYGHPSSYYRNPIREWATFAFAHDLGDITSTQEPLMWAFGLVRTPNIKYRSQERYPYFWTKYSTIHGAVRFFGLTYLPTVADVVRRSRILSVISRMPEIEPLHLTRRFRVKRGMYRSSMQTSFR